jgi:hypothetical protein
MLGPAADRFATQPLDVGALGGEVSEYVGRDGRHLVVRDHGELRLWLPRTDPDQPLSVVIPFDDDLDTRLDATLRFWRRINKPGSPLHEPFPLTEQQRDRLILMLRALDGHLDEASYREIAEVLFGSRRMESEPWKTSSLRDRTIRLVRGGIALMESGYRKLLRGR